MLASIRNEIGKAEVENAMKDMGLDPNNKKAVAKYSFRDEAKIRYSSLIMENPQLIFDEPTNGLDSDGVKLFSQVVNKMRSKV